MPWAPLQPPAAGRRRPLTSCAPPPTVWTLYERNKHPGGTKPATLETGAVLNVPLFIEVGEMVKIDTRTDTYLSRSKE